MVKAPDWGSGGREFKSRRPDHFSNTGYTAGQNVGTRCYRLSMDQLWTDDGLREAVADSRSWRGVMRALSLCPTSTSRLNTVKTRVVQLGLDTSHFSGQRTWSDTALKHAAAQARSWTELLDELKIGARSGDDRIRIKAHAARLGIDLAHLDADTLRPISKPIAEPALDHLRGYNTAIPMEPTIYDLLVTMPEGIQRVQVKTTIHFGKAGWAVTVGRRPYSIGNSERRVPYDPELIDLFFIMDGDLNIYLIPSQVIAGRVGILLRGYQQYLAGNATGLMAPQSCAA